MFEIFFLFQNGIESSVRLVLMVGENNPDALHFTFSITAYLQTLRVISTHAAHTCSQPMGQCTYVSLMLVIKTYLLVTQATL